MFAALVLVLAIAVALSTGSTLANYKGCQDANGQCGYLATQQLPSSSSSTNPSQFAKCCLGYRAGERFSIGGLVLPRGGGRGEGRGGRGRRGEEKAAHERRARKKDEKIQRRRGISQRTPPPSRPPPPPPRPRPPPDSPSRPSQPPPSGSGGSYLITLDNGWRFIYLYRHPKPILILDIPPHRGDRPIRFFAEDESDVIYAIHHILQMGNILDIPDIDSETR